VYIYNIIIIHLLSFFVTFIMIVFLLFFFKIQDENKIIYYLFYYLYTILYIYIIRIRTTHEILILFTWTDHKNFF
jgi:hypothetical protein